MTVFPAQPPFLIACDDNGALVAAVFGDVDVLARRVPKGFALQAASAADDRAAGASPAVRGLCTARRQFEEYFAGLRRAFELPLHPAVSPFQQRIRQVLLEIPFGAARTYGEIARQLGTSPRAVGRAVGANPLAVVVPCHRVLGSGGSLTGFAFGLPLKLALLSLEGIPSAPP